MTYNKEDRPAYIKRQIVVSPPGYFVLDYQFSQNDGPIQIAQEPVLAWIVSVFESYTGEVTTEAAPVSHEEHSSFYEGAVLYPNGRVIIPGKHEFKTLEAYRQHVNEHHHNNQSTFENKRHELHAAKFERKGVQNDRS